MFRLKIFRSGFAAVLILGVWMSGAWGGEMKPDLEKATFAAGCFWGVEKIFAAIPGVVSTQVGYTGGNVKNPGYELVSTGLTGHAEAIEVTYDASKIKYEDLLEFFWKYHDPTTLNRQDNDTGTQYRSAIFYHTPEQKKAAEKTKDILERSGIFKNPIVTEIVPASEFYRAEEYHQQYLKKNPNGYCSIHLQSTKIEKVLREASRT